MLNVLTFSTLYPNSAQPHFGGFVERQTQRLAARDDVNLKVIAPIGKFILPVGPYAALHELPASSVRHDVEIFNPRFPLIPAIGWRLNPYFVRKAATRVIAAMIEDGFCPDVIDCEFFWPDAPAAIALGQMFNIPVSIKARGSDIRFWGKRPAARRMMCKAAESSGGQLAVSQSLKTDMAAIGMDRDRITVHYTGVELDDFKPAANRSAAQAALGHSHPMLLAVGNLVPLKRIHVLIEMMQHLPQAKLVIVGEGAARSQLQTAIRHFGLTKRVELMGLVPHGDIPALMAAADVFVHASSSEGLANVWIEALASGTPVVTSNVGGASEVVSAPEYGRLVDDATPENLAAAVQAVLDNPTTPDAIRAGALRFSWARNTEMLYDHLCKVAGR